MQRAAHQHRQAVRGRARWRSAGGLSASRFDRLATEPGGVRFWHGAEYHDRLRLAQPRRDRKRAE